jgi:D-alanyl-D-alanine-carboxypeptidase/D-alanyl-D-alanine-endopeptidase
VWQISAVSKVFTSRILASRVAVGEVKLTDPLAKFLPEHAKLPEISKHQIFLLNFATHAAGFPRGIIPNDESDSKPYPHQYHLLYQSRPHSNYLPGVISFESIRGADTMCLICLPARPASA